MEEKERQILERYLLTNTSYSFSEELYENDNIRRVLQKIHKLYLECCFEEYGLTKLNKLQTAITTDIGAGSLLDRELKKFIQSLRFEYISKDCKLTDWMLKIQGAIDLDRKA